MHFHNLIKRIRFHWLPAVATNEIDKRLNSVSLTIRHIRKTSCMSDCQRQKEASDLIWLVKRRFQLLYWKSLERVCALCSSINNTLCWLIYLKPLRHKTTSVRYISSHSYSHLPLKVNKDLSSHAIANSVTRLHRQADFRPTLWPVFWSRV